MPTRNVDLTDRFNQFVDAQVASGRYQDVSEVMRAGLSLLEQQTAEDDRKLMVLKALADDAMSLVRRGQGIPWNDPEELKSLFDEISQRATASVDSQRLK